MLSINIQVKDQAKEAKYKQSSVKKESTISIRNLVRIYIYKASWNASNKNLLSISRISQRNLEYSQF